MHLPTRMRRLRHNATLRDLVARTQLIPDDFVLPLFIKHGNNLKTPISSMPGLYQYSIDALEEKIKSIVNSGVKAVMLFGIPPEKDARGSDSLQDDGIMQQAIRCIKSIAPSLYVMTDICFCEYMDHGHCGIMNERSGQMDLDNDPTLELMQQQSLSHVRAGADMVVPSGMMDGAVAAIRETLDDNGYHHIPILPHTMKFASNLYGPFREAAEGDPQFGDRKSYQADYRQSEQALREATLDLEEGADMLMVKPANMYLDVLRLFRDHFPEVPLAAYQVSGEFSMLKNAVLNGTLNEDVIIESLIAIKRAGADLIITYFAEEIVQQLNKGLR
jgi:porphobilinogen synthase